MRLGQGIAGCLGSLSAWIAADAGARETLADSLVRSLGAAFERASPGGELGLASVLHRPTGVVFRAIPGGTFTMGMTDDELAEIEALAEDRAAEATAIARLARPPHTVHVRPFLLASTQLSAKLVCHLLGNTRPVDHFRLGSDLAVIAPAEAKSAVQALGCRLASEAEWEFVAREGGSRRWLGEPPGKATLDAMPEDDAGLRENVLDVRDLVSESGEFVADSWHRVYDGAPADGAAWQPLDEPGVLRGGTYDWQDPLEVLTLHAAARRPATGQTAGLRAAIGL